MCVGSCFLDVFGQHCRPHKNRLNMAMLYVVGPKGKDSDAGHGPQLATEAFLESVADTSRNAMQLVADYNESQQVKVQNVGWCLVSGGVYKPPDATKLDVALATLRGILLVQNRPMVTFAYDDDVFKSAWFQMQQASEQRS